MAFNDGVKAGPIAYIGLVSVLGTFILVLALQVLYHRQFNSMSEADLASEGPPSELTELTAKQQNALNQSGYVDREQGVVAIGIDRAKELVVSELADQKAPNEVIGPKRQPQAPAKEAATTEDGAEADPETSAEEAPKGESDSASPAVEPAKVKQEPNDDDEA